MTLTAGCFANKDGTSPMEWEATRIAGGQENPVMKASKKVEQ